MKKFSSVAAIKHEIESYGNHFSGAPLVVGIDQQCDYRELLTILEDDESKTIVRMSNACNEDFPMRPVYQMSQVNVASKQSTVIWIGATVASMLLGQKETEEFLIKLLGYNFTGPVAVLCPYCTNILESIAREYTKLGYYIICLESAEKDIPSIQLYGTDAGSTIKDALMGIKSLIQKIENGAMKYDSLKVVTACDMQHLENSLFPVMEGKSAYRRLCELIPNLGMYMKETEGTSADWQGIISGLDKCHDFAVLCAQELCSVDTLPLNIGDFVHAKNSFLYYAALKIYYSQGKDYLAYCLGKINDANELERAIYFSILNLDPADKNFDLFMRQRRKLITSLDDNSALMKSFCEQATIKAKDILWYLSDETEEERAAIIHALCCYPYSENELQDILSHVSLDLYLYLQKFTFDEFNTRVMESDASVRELLTDYFQRYKLQKLMNHQDKDFVELVEEEAKTRSFMKLQSRSAIVKKLDKKSVQPYFFDALGAEFLAYIQYKANEYGMQFECLVGHCNLPSITSKNKEFYASFPGIEILKEEGLDELKHHGTKYDFTFTTEPLHIFDELSLLDRDLKKMGSALGMGNYEKILILSDHGASRLAVTYRSENDKLELEEAGKHSGRCCPASSDPGIEFATFEDGFAVLANYERFKGSRKADVETHGGASLEEVVVPVIILTKKPKEQIVYFVEKEIPCSAKDGSTIKLFANPPLQNPRMVINDVNYQGKFDGDKHNVTFNMPDIKRKGQHEADIYDGGKKVATLTFETKRNTATNTLI